MRIVDAHHHLWKLSELYYPWLSDQIRTVAYGDYAAIRKDYVLNDFRRDIGALNVVKSVHLQADHDPRDPVAETRWLQQLADDPSSNGFPHAIVAFVDLSRADAADILDQHQTYANVRGVRQMLHAGPAAAHLTNELWRRNLAELSGRSLSFDLQIRPDQMQLAFDIIAANPGIAFILDHAGCPKASPVADRPLTDSPWLDGIARLSTLHNVVIKLSGFGMFDRSWSATSIAPIVQQVLALFGVERCMFGSNFPVDSLMKDYRGIWSAFEETVAHLSDTNRELLFAGNAERIYRI
jgi:predicted TIM-barrel fold metal-dependent hydrolase